MGEKNESMPPIGIDLGTTYSCVAVWQNGKVEIIPNDQGNLTTPSCVAFTKTERLIGDAAKNQASLNPSNTIFDCKRLIGRKFSDEAVQDYIKLWPFKVVAGDSELNSDIIEKKPLIQVDFKGKKKEFSPEEISAMILGKMKQVAEAYLGLNITDAVITVPARFNNLQRQATKDAGVIAGLNVLRVINEPTAAAIAYGFNNKATSKKNVLVFDLGGGTFDVSLVAMDNELFEVRSVSGDTHLGGEDFDNRLIDHFVSEFKRKHGKDLTGNGKAIGRLRVACERAKRILSSTSLTNIDIDCLFDGIDFSSSLSRAKFEKLNLDLFESCISPVDKCLKDAKLNKNDVHEVVLVGGSSRIPKVQELLQKYFGGKSLCRSINEAVAYGAAAHAAVLSGVVTNDAVIVDVAPLCLGIESNTGKMSVLIKRNTPIPTKKEKLFTTTYDNQPEVEISVYEGEKRVAKRNNLLGNFTLSGIPPSRKRALTITDCFEIDQDGILKCCAQEMSTGSKNGITITDHSGRLSNDQVKQLRKDNAKFNAADEKKRRKDKAKNDLESYAHDMKAMVTNHGKRIGINDRRKMEEAIEKTIQWVDWNVLKIASKFEEKMKELQSICEPIIVNIHKQPDVGNKVNPIIISEIIEID